MVKPFEIAGRLVGPGAPCFFIAEAGVNHNGEISTAIDLIDGAVAAAVDAVKFQTFSAARIALAAAPKAEYQKEADGSGESQREMLRRLELSQEDHVRLMEHSANRRMLFLSSPFDEESADLLERLNIAAFKIPSGELTNLSFLAHVARKGRPMIVSTGMASMDEVEQAVKTIRDNGNPSLALLHCVSSYPTAPKDCNLKAMDTLRDAFDVPVGWSDHTQGMEVSLAAVARGACIIEKHFTLSRSMPGPDHKASMEVDEMASLMTALRVVESAIGDGGKAPKAAEAEVANVARKSLVSMQDLKAGEALTSGDITARRPGTGIPADKLNNYLGRHLKIDVPEGTLLSADMFEEG